MNTLGNRLLVDARKIRYEPQRCGNWIPVFGSQPAGYVIVNRLVGRLLLLSARSPAVTVTAVLGQYQITLLDGEGMNNLPRVVIQRWNSRESNLPPLHRESCALINHQLPYHYNKTYVHRVSKKTSTHIIGYKLRNSCPILIIFDTKIPHIIWHRKTA